MLGIRLRRTLHAVPPRIHPRRVHLDHNRPTPPVNAARPPPPVVPRRPRIELHPAPLKATVRPASTPLSPPSPSPLELAKDDIRSASAHGILVPPPSDASWPRKLYHQARELFKFYWKGLKLIFANRRHAREIELRIAGGGAPLTRWESRFIASSRTDVVKLVPFVLILVILEEALPLFVLYAPFLLPSTCLLASQRVRIASKRAAKHASLVASSRAALGRIVSGVQPDPKLMCRVLALSAWGPQSLSERRLGRHIAMLASDDPRLLGEANGQPHRILANLSQDELTEVLAERGFSTTEVTSSYARESLEWYFGQPMTDRVGLLAQAALKSTKTAL